MRGVRLWWIATTIVFGLPSGAFADPRLTVAGGLAMFEDYTEANGPAGSLALSRRVVGRWRTFVRAGYERHSAPLGLSTCTAADCPLSADATARAWFVPVSWGMRFGSAAEANEEAYVELAPTLVFSSFELDVREHYGSGLTIERRSSDDYWLPGLELGVGVADRSVPFEIFARGRWTVAPRDTENYTSYALRERDGLVRLIVGLAFDLSGRPKRRAL